MKPYWIKIERQSGPKLLSLGAGITAYSEADARLLFEAAFGSGVRISEVQPIADMREIEQNHVAPNMGNWFNRGIWFPLGYEQISG